MRFLPLILACLLTACGSGRTNRSILDEDPKRAKTRVDLDRVVAYYNGEPLTWAEVAERMMELNLKDAVEKYVWWRVVHDQKRIHGIKNTDDELYRRAKAAVEDLKKKSGEKALADRLKAMKMTEEEYIKTAAKSDNINKRLDLEKLVVYHFLSKGAISLDWVLFTEEEDAKIFVEYIAVEKDFDKAFVKVGKTKVKGRNQRVQTGWFAKGFEPQQMDEWVVDEAFRLKKGESSKVETSRSGMFFVVRVLDRIEPREASYADLADDVFEHILRDPPAEELLGRFIGWHYRKSKIEYEDRRSKGD